MVVGFTSGIGVIIFVGQWAAFAGLKPAAGLEFFHEKLWALLMAMPHTHWPTLALGVGTLLVLIISPLLIRKIPAPLVAMVAATLAQAMFKFDGVATIGSAVGGIPQSLVGSPPPAQSHGRRPMRATAPPVRLQGLFIR